MATRPGYEPMKTKHLLLLVVLSFLSTLNVYLSTAFAEDTAFTYQGRLNDNGSPATGVYDFTFQAFNAPTAGGSVGGTVNVNAVGVTNGLFTALVDLGGSPFTGPARWLQISVSTNGAGSFTTLARARRSRHRPTRFTRIPPARSRMARLPAPSLPPTPSRRETFRTTPSPLPRSPPARWSRA